MNVHIVFMHPEVDSWNGSVLKKVREVLPDASISMPAEELTTLSLTVEEYKQQLQGIYPEEVKKEHKKMADADHYVWVFPVWWGTFPAAGKAFLDRVLSYGFAYELEGEEPVPLLKGKNVSLLFSTGAPESEFMQSGSYDNMVQLIEKQICDFCGMELHTVLHFGNAVLAGDKERADYLKRVETFAAGLN
ncbi:NAD(P)H-dependent oxidoreductase [Alkalicoccus urumqiensis]|uniref:Flavodoxin-like fold domain-containing protein n=1 Tax=Alkalicoccus urumqiensis TaxID=1548213 RepID=A0A2P6MEW9_ALKUR|nr:NAD(P)H-dependent oxidoreductase [Alkalicoccus urumqiensis]PRO64865.1 hypothetical protein C6I21_12005 [Alkalicoccus urumqiensis]